MTINQHEAELALALQAELGEGPVWDERSQELYFVDIMGHRVHAFAPQSAAHRSFSTPGPVGAVVLRDDGGLVLAAADGFFSRWMRASARRTRTWLTRCSWGNRCRNWLHCSMACAYWPAKYASCATCQTCSEVGGSK